MERLLNTADAAEILGVNPSWLNFRRSKGVSDPPYVRVGGLVKYRQSDLEAFIERNLVCE